MRPVVPQPVVVRRVVALDVVLVKATPAFPELDRGVTPVQQLLRPQNCARRIRQFGAAEDVVDIFELPDGQDVTEQKIGARICGQPGHRIPASRILELPLECRTQAVTGSGWQVLLEDDDAVGPEPLDDVL